MLILQPFSIEVFQQGVPDQPRLLLKCIGQSRSVVTRVMKEYEEDISAKRAMKDRERQEKKKATMRENAVELNAKRVARAESDTWICKICKEEKSRKEYSKYQWEGNRKNETAVCLTCPTKTVRCKECGKRKGRKEYTQCEWRYHREDGKSVCKACVQLMA